MIKVLHLITGLSMGGAEMMLLRLLRGGNKEKIRNVVVSMMDEGVLGAEIESLGIPLHCLRMRSGMSAISGSSRFFRLLKIEKPDVIKTWMYHANLLGGVAGYLGRYPVVWGIHAPDLNPECINFSTRIVARIGAYLSKTCPSRIVTDSQTGGDFHAEYGYSQEKIHVITNGADLDNFSPNESTRKAVRKELGIPEDAILIGQVGQYHPRKDYHNFIHAANLVHKKYPDTKFILCGKGLTLDNHVLVSLIDQYRLRSSCYLVGERLDVARIMSAFDIASSSSLREAFPLVVGEAMACGIPCVATETGDSAWIVEDTGLHVPVRDPEALAKAFCSLIDMGQAGRKKKGMQARHRMETLFSLSKCINDYETLFEDVALS